MQTLEAISIRLQRAGRTLLFLQVSRDGHVKRLGTGEPASSDTSLVFGGGHPEFFAALLPRVTPELLGRAGRVYEMPSRPGEAIELDIGFIVPGDILRLGFRYGSEGAAPPDEVRELVALAVTLTDDWYAALRGA